MSVLIKHGIRRRRLRRNQLPFLLGDMESTGVVTITPDTTPELNFRFPGSTPASIEITDGTTTYGPYPVAGTVAQVSPDIPAGIYTVVTLAEDKKGNLVAVGGQVEIRMGTIYSGFGGIGYSTNTGIGYKVGA